uniref:Ninein-like n=1 Tax=Oryzias melastigma TaxID=30732 RepID=A0A3B3CUD7_ORYME
MEEAGHSHYVAQLKAEFDGCDTTATGFLDRDELTELCRRLQLDAQLPLLLHTLLGERTHGRVNFEEFKEAFVEVLSRSLDLNTSEDDSSYLDSEMKPKFVKGAKRYGRRSRPDSEALTCDSEDSPPSKNEATDSSASGVRRAKQRRSTSLESVEVSILKDGWSHMIEVPSWLQDMNGRFCRTEAQLDGGVSITEFRRFLSSSSPASRSTPKRGADLQRAPLEERPARSAAPSLLTATVGQRVLSRLDDGSGCTSPERVAALWTEEGIQNSRDILQTLDFSLEERLSLADLTLALDNELLVSGNGIHQAALISYKNEIQEAAEQACRERDKLRADLEEADHRNLQLVREVDDRHASMETLNQSKIRDLEQDFRDRLTTLRCEAELESEAQLQLGEQERRALQEELQLLRAQEAELQEELRHAAQVGTISVVERAPVCLRVTLQISVQTSDVLDQIRICSCLDPAGSALSHEERVSELIKEYELQCRVRVPLTAVSPPSGFVKVAETSVYLENMKKMFYNLTNRLNLKHFVFGVKHKSESVKAVQSKSWSLQVNPLLSGPPPAPDGAAGPTVSIQTELAVEQLQQKHRQELQQLSIQLETQMNFYERSLEKMRESMEVERKDISQAFKLEISELEEQKTQLEQEVKQLKAAFFLLFRLIWHLANILAGYYLQGFQHLQWPNSANSIHSSMITYVNVSSFSYFKANGGLDVFNIHLVHDTITRLLKYRLSGSTLMLSVGRGGSREELESCKASWEEQRKMEVQHKEEIRRLEEEVKEFHQSKRSLEAGLKAGCSELKESTSLPAAQEDLDSCSVTGRSSEEELPVHLCSSLLQERHAALQLQASEQTVASLRSELRSQQEALRSKARSICSLAAELDLLKTDRRRLIQDLKDQAMAVDLLQLELDGASEELNQRRSNEASLQEALKREQSRTSQLQSGLQEQQEELCRLAQEKSRSVRLADQLSAQILEMEEEISSLREHLRGLSARLNDTADLVLELRRQLNSRTSEEAARGAQNNELERVREQVLLLQRALQNSQNQLGSAQENFDRERGRMVQQLMGMERLVLELEKEMDPAGSDRGGASCSPRTPPVPNGLSLCCVQEQYEKAMSALQQRVDDLEVKLKGVRLVLQEKVQELREQLVKSSKASALLKDAHAENAQLMMALQVTERRQKLAERRSVLLEEKVGALHQLLRDIVPAALAT